MFRSLRRYNYRWWFVGAIISNIGQWMQSTAMSWVVLTALTDDDAAAMGVALGLQFGPPLLLVGVTGWVADRFDRRRLLAITQVALAVIATTIGVLLLTGVMTIWLMYGFCLLLGVVTAFDTPARQSFVSDIVPREDTPNAVALNSASFNVARLIGPAVAGFALVALPAGWVFLVNAVTYLAMLLALWRMRAKELVPRARPAGAQRFADGFRYVAGRPDLVVLFIMVFLLGTFGMNFPITASTMTLEFGRDADGYGLLNSILAIGALVGSLLAARRSRASMRIIILAMGLFGLSMVGGALAPDYWWYALSGVFAGFAAVTSLTSANAYTQTTTAPHVRGRVLAIYFALLVGGTLVGAPTVGWVAETLGPRMGVAIGAAAGIAACVIGLSWFLATRGSLRTATSALAIVEAEPQIPA